MNCVWVQRDGRSRVLIFFAGWGMDERPFRRLTSSTRDVCVCFDYRNLPAAQSALGRAEFQHPLLGVSADYDEVTVVAWSFGCVAAAHVLARSDWPLLDAVAINGTVTAGDEAFGVAPRWLDATAQQLLQGGWDRFVRRMCPDQPARQSFRDHAPRRDLGGTLEELEWLRRLPTPATCPFRRAIIGTRDRIILPENQQRGWQRFAVPLQTIAAPHYPFHLWKTWEELLAAPADHSRQTE